MNPSTDDRAQADVTQKLDGIKKRFIAGDAAARLEYWREVFAQERLSLIMREPRAANDPMSGGPVVMDFGGQRTFLVYAGGAPGAALGAMMGAGFCELDSTTPDLFNAIFRMAPDIHVAINHNPAPADDDRTISEPIWGIAMLWEYVRPDLPTSLWNAFIAGVSAAKQEMGRQRLWTRLAQQPELFMLMDSNGSNPAAIAVGPQTMALVTAVTEDAAQAMLALVRKNPNVPPTAQMVRVPVAKVATAIAAFNGHQQPQIQKAVGVGGTNATVFVPVEVALRAMS